jgi:aminomethyltransferase
MKKTALNAIHHNLGAKMVEFAGYEMPVIYSNITDEHMAVRNHAGIFDVSHMGQFFVSGKDSRKLVQYLTSNNVAKLRPGKAQYSCLPNMKGGIIDDLIVYRLPDGQDKQKNYMLVVNAANIEKDFNWIEENNDFDATVEDRSDEFSLIAVQGPKATEWLQHFTDADLKNIPFYEFEIGNLADADNVIISNTGYTGSGGFELYVQNEDAVNVWNALIEKAESYHALPCGLGSRDTLRLEKGYCLYGNDLSDETSPIEAGLSWIVKTKVKSNFVAKDIFVHQKESGVERKLMGFKLDSRRVPRNGYKIFNETGDQEIGFVTSGTQSPCLNIPIGMGYLQIDHAQAGNKIQIQMGKKNHPAEVTVLPFV